MTEIPHIYLPLTYFKKKISQKPTFALFLSDFYPIFVYRNVIFCVTTLYC